MCRGIYRASGHTDQGAYDQEELHHFYSSRHTTQELEARLEQLRREIESIRSERDQVERELEVLRSEREQFDREIEAVRLESERLDRGIEVVRFVRDWVETVRARGS